MAFIIKKNDAKSIRKTYFLFIKHSLSDAKHFFRRFSTHKMYLMLILWFFAEFARGQTLRGSTEFLGNLTASQFHGLEEFAHGQTGDRWCADQGVLFLSTLAIGACAACCCCVQRCVAEHYRGNVCAVIAIMALCATGLLGLSIYYMVLCMVPLAEDQWVVIIVISIIVGVAFFGLAVATARQYCCPYEERRPLAEPLIDDDDDDA